MKFTIEYLEVKVDRYDTFVHSLLTFAGYGLLQCNFVVRK